MSWHIERENMQTIENKIVDNKVTGRISEVQRSLFYIRYDGKEIPAVLKGKFHKDKLEFPVVGDYVTFLFNPYGDSVIVEIQERKSLLKRPDQSGHAMPYVKTMMEQVMVANFDYVFIMVSLNDNYNLNRIARYVSLTLQGGGLPVVILTKSDLCENTGEFVQEVQKLSDKVQVHAICSLTGEGLNELQEYMKPEATIAFLGSSGVGKSTLVNALAGEDIMKTGAIRETDSKGKHTTTSRELIELPNGVILIDTPGMRELGMCDVEEGINDTFSDIEELFTQCRFRNCSHGSEPGCAVHQALENGTLEEKRWKLYQSLQNESNKAAKMKAIAKKRRKL